MYERRAEEVGVSIHVQAAGCNSIFKCGGGGRNGNEIHERPGNMYTEAISRSNVYEWIKKFNEGCTELHNEV